MTTSSSEVDRELHVIGRTVETWNSGDVDGFLDCLTDDVYWDDPAMLRPAENKLDVR
jgi:ketosteroid isomerase-like protein